MADVKAPALSPALVMQAEFVRVVHSVKIPPNIPFASILSSDFWAHCASKFKPYDKIECRAQDNTWYGELMVRRVEPLAVHVWALHYVDLTAQAVPQRSVTAEDFAVGYGGPHHQWRVVRLSDKAVIHKGEASEGDAQAWLENHLKAPA